MQAWKLGVNGEAICRLIGFNGATLLQAWKLAPLAFLVGLGALLQWGHAFASVETASCAVGQAYHFSSPLRPEVVRQAHILAG